VTQYQRKGSWVRSCFKRMAPPIVLLACFALAAAGCGASPEEKAAAEQAEKEAAKQSKRADKLIADAATCQSQIDGLLTQLQALDSKLSVGLNFEGYADEVSAANVKYDSIAFKNLPIECTVKVGVPAEKSLNRHLDAYDVWNECFEDIYCSFDSIDPEIQAAWAKASSSLRQAESGLRGIRSRALSADDAAIKAKEKAAELSANL
jgi:hypothetical protein